MYSAIITGFIMTYAARFPTLGQGGLPAAVTFQKGSSCTLQRDAFSCEMALMPIYLVNPTSSFDLCAARMASIALNDSSILGLAVDSAPGSVPWLEGLLTARMMSPRGRMPWPRVYRLLLLKRAWRLAVVHTEGLSAASRLAKVGTELGDAGKGRVKLLIEFLGSMASKHCMNK